MVISRIPVMKNNDFNSLQLWFSEMHTNDFLFHPDDDPAEIVSIKSGELMFTQTEVAQLRTVIDSMFQLHGDKVYEAGYAVLMSTFSLPEDAYLFPV